MVMRGLRDSGRVIEDPEIGEYLQSLGLRLSSLAQDGNRDFSFFIVRDPAINAFALPGGFVGIHSGLLMETNRESELAAVLAHEVAHVTQRHIARGLENQSRVNMVSTAATLAAILIGAMAGGGSDVTMGAVSAAQGLAAQAQINYTRENEYEADRVGMGILAAAGFDPNSMASFFETMGRRTQLAPDVVPELLRTHPVTSARIAEARGRAAQYPVSAAVVDGLSYSLTKERVRVLTTPSGEDPRQYYASLIVERAGRHVGAVLWQGAGPTGRGRYGSSRRRVHAAARRPSRGAAIPHRARPGPAGRRPQQRARSSRWSGRTILAPRNVPVTVRYGEALLQAGRPKRAHEVLLDLFNNVPPSQEQIRLTAIAANAAGDVADAYSYMAEYHLMGGDLPLAINQLELALSVPGLSEVQRAKFVARLKEIREWLPKERAKMQRAEPAPRPPGG